MRASATCVFWLLLPKISAEEPLRGDGFIGADFKVSAELFCTGNSAGALGTTLFSWREYFIAAAATVAEMQTPSINPSLSCRRLAERYRCTGTSPLPTSISLGGGNRIFVSPAPTVPEKLGKGARGGGFCAAVSHARGTACPTDVPSCRGSVLDINLATASVVPERFGKGARGGGFSAGGSHARGMACPTGAASCRGGALDTNLATASAVPKEFGKGPRGGGFSAGGSHARGTACPTDAASCRGGALDTNLATASASRTPILAGISFAVPQRENPSLGAS